MSTRDLSQKGRFTLAIVETKNTETNFASKPETSSFDASKPSAFKKGVWQSEVNVDDFIEQNLTSYFGGSEFLCPPSEKTKKVWAQVTELMKQEQKKSGVLDAETDIPSGIVAYPAGYIDRENEVIVGLQTDKPLKRALMPFGGIRMAEAALESYGYKIAPQVSEIFSKYRKTHNEGVFDAYTPAMKLARKTAIITGLPDAYGRGRIIGDYRRVALYGVDRLIVDKKQQMKSLEVTMNEEVIRLREEIAEQIHALEELAKLGDAYGFNLRPPAQTAAQAVQWTYFAFLASVKEQNGAAMSIGRVSSFFDVYIERDLAQGILNESQAQELFDQFVIKLRMVRFARTPDYNDLFSGDPTWVTESIGGMGKNGKTLVTKSSFRVLNTLYNLGPSPEPNLTVLWSRQLPVEFKKFCAKVSIETSSVQYEGDDLMRPMFGSDYGIACCVSAMKLGQQMQFFGARANLAKALLYAINGGVDEVTGDLVAPGIAPLTAPPTTLRVATGEAEVLNYDQIMVRFEQVMDWLASLYVNTLNVIHYMHDKYSYERMEMALHDRDVERRLACGIAGLSVVADSLSAIRFAKVKPIRNEKGVAMDFVTEGDYPKYGNNDPRVDKMAQDLVQMFNAKLQKQSTYRKAVPTLSVLTITSNVVYGKKTGNTPDGRRLGQPFAPGANPMHGRDAHGALAALASVAHLPYGSAQDGISNTFSIVPSALGREMSEKQTHLVGVLDGYFADGGHHLNVNVFNRETLMDAMKHPENYPQLTIRVSGYAVHFVKLTREQQEDVINRTFHQYM